MSDFNAAAERERIARKSCEIAGLPADAIMPDGLPLWRCHEGCIMKDIKALEDCGYAVVLREPSDEMVAVGVGALIEDNACEIYRAMLATSPKLMD